MLDEILLQASLPLLDLWLREALAAGVGLPPERWAPVLDRARRATGLNRARLGAALGPRGLWFARHNPAWSAVVRAAEVPAPDDALAAEPARAVVRTLAAGEQSVGGARTLGQQTAARLPLALYPELVEAGRDPTNAAARAGLAAAEEVLWVRWALASAFDPYRVPPERHPVRTVPTLPTRQERP
nr:DUF5691 domain-containing protein [Microlunatus antarcticus]